MSIKRNQQFSIKLIQLKPIDVFLRLFVVITHVSLKIMKKVTQWCEPLNVFRNQNSLYIYHWNGSHHWVTFFIILNETCVIITYSRKKTSIGFNWLSFIENCWIRLMLIRKYKNGHRSPVYITAFSNEIIKNNQKVKFFLSRKIIYFKIFENFTQKTMKIIPVLGS
jgi:hypothetical protein